MIGRIADYELLEKIGEGGMGAVFKARNPRLDSVVAVKILLHELARDPEYRARFMREARAEASLHHNSIATCFDVGEARLEPPDLLYPGSPGPHPERVLYLVMEYVPGHDLHQLIGEHPLEITKVLDLAIQIAAGLESAHKSGVIHRDLKSANIRVTPEGQVKIVDFGLSRIVPADLTSKTLTLSTKPEQVIGTVQFMAPEQQRGRTTDPRSDLFSLGVVIYHLVTGRLPFTGGTVYEVINKVAIEDPPPLARYASNVPVELERIVRKLIAKDPEQRYTSAHDVRIDLERLRRELDKGKTKSWWTQFFRGRWRQWALIGAAALVVLLAAGWAWLRYGPLPARTIAVMPFVNGTGDPRLDYLGDGIASSLIADLVRRARFNVTTLKSARAELDPGHPAILMRRRAVEVARALGVGAVVEGSLRREGAVTYLDVRLTDGRSGVFLWADQFPYVIDNAFDIEQEIVRQVVAKIDPWRPPGRTASAAGSPRSPSAYDLYLRGGFHLEDPGDDQGADRAFEHYARAIEVDPDFALAWAGESRALYKIWTRDKTEESIRRSEETANHAIHLDPLLVEARLARAQIFRVHGHYGLCIRELQGVLRVNPQWNEALIHLSAAYRDSGDMASAVTIQRRAVELQPGYWRNWSQLGHLFWRLAQYDSAEAAYREVIRLAPEKNVGYEGLIAVGMSRGNFAGAVEAYEKLPVASATTASNIATGFYYEGRLTEARRFYGLAVQLEPRDYKWRWHLGDTFARVGEPDSARMAYTQAVGLVSEQLHVDQNNSRLRLDRAVLNAKLARCGESWTELAEISSRLPTDDAECAIRIAKLNALCGRTAEAIEAIRRALSLGAALPYVLRQDELASLSRDARFQAMTRTRQELNRR